MPTLSSLKQVPLWRKIQKENFTNLDSLLDFLALDNEKRTKVRQFSQFPLNLPRRLAEKIEKNNVDDPIFLQFVPLLEEGIKKEGFSLDPVGDLSFRSAPKLLKKYEGRALLVTTSACAMNCRFCFRQNFPYEKEVGGFEKELDLIKKDPSLKEIILSGGDPLSLSDASLQELLSALSDIPHIERIRFHTRFPIGIPERIDPSFLEVLRPFKNKIFFIIHSNHPKELDSDVIDALGKIRCLGIPLLNQSVLLKGVNDDPKTLLSLSETLLKGQILPYYLHLLDPVEGAGHFLIPENRALEAISYIQRHLSGFGVPRLVREEPGKPSKTFASPL